MINESEHGVGRWCRDSGLVGMNSRAEFLECESQRDTRESRLCLDTLFYSTMSSTVGSLAETFGVLVGVPRGAKSRSVF